MFLLAEVTIFDQANLTTRDNINGNYIRIPISAGTSSNLRYNLAAVIYFGQDNVAPRPTTFHTIIIMRSGYWSHYDRRQLLVYDNRSSDGKFVALERQMTRDHFRWFILRRSLQWSDSSPLTLYSLRMDNK